MAIAPGTTDDEIAAGFVELQQLNIQYDRFIRTTASNHEAIVKEFFQRVWEKAIYIKKNRAGTASPAKNLKKRELWTDTAVRSTHKASGVARQANYSFGYHATKASWKRSTKTTGFYPARKSPE